MSIVFISILAPSPRVVGIKIASRGVSITRRACVCVCVCVLVVQDELYAYVNRTTQDTMVVSRRQQNGSTVTGYVSHRLLYPGPSMS